MTVGSYTSMRMVGRKVLRDVKKNDRNGGEGTTRLSSTEGSGNRAVIGGRDGNSRNYAVKGTKGSGQD